MSILTQVHQQRKDALASRLKPGVAAVFVHTRDVKRVVEWYGMVLGIPVRIANGATFYLLPLIGTPGAPNIIFERRDDPSPRPQVLWSFGSSGIDATYRFLQAHGVEITTEIIREGGTQWFHFRDPDGNILMACQA